MEDEFEEQLEGELSEEYTQEEVVEEKFTSFKIETKPDTNKYEEEDKQVDDLLEMDDYVKELIMKSDPQLYNKINILKKDDSLNNIQEKHSAVSEPKTTKKNTRKVNILD